MDQAKTTIPQLDLLPKTLHISKKLQVSLTWMLIHGHGKGAYGHFALGYWPYGPDFTIGSLAGCLQHLELNSEDGKGDLHYKYFIEKQAIFHGLLS